MATSTLEIVIQAKDEAGSKLKGLADSAKKLEPAFKQMAVVGGVAFASISAFAISSIKSSNEAELAQKQLEHAVISVSKATRAQLKETEDLANALEAKGVLDGDNIKIGLAQLSTFGLSNKAVRGLGGALSDLAVNQFGVNASGEQMSQTANMIAKALNGQFGVLEKSGIRFSESQRHMIEFGTEMEKVSAINEGFAQNLKFTNDVALKTTDGQLAKLNVQFDNLKTSIGDQLKPVLIQLLQAITPILLKITDWVAQNPELTRNIILIVGALTGLVAIVGALGIAMLALTPAMLTAMGTALAITAVLALLGLAVYNVSQIMYILKYDSALVLLGIKTYFQEFVAWINAKVVNPIKDYFRDV
jgi:hypothetical protein